MGRIVGNILAILSCCCTLLQAEVRLNIQTMDGKPLKQAAVGQPFMLEVIREGVSPQLSSPDIKGLESFVVKNSGLQMRTTNGVSTVKYQYVLRADSPGTFTIGPALLYVGNQHIYSNQVTLTVATEQQVDQQAMGPKKHKEPAFMRLSLDKTEAIVGEKVAGTVRFYAADGSILFHDLHAPKLDDAGLDIDQEYGPEQGTEQIQGNTYHYAQWSWHAYPTKEGTLVVPAYWAEYSINEGRNGFFSQFFNRVFKRVYSNAVTLVVDSLPNTDQHIDAVGHYTQFTAQIDKSATRQGDAMVLTLELVGDGDVERLKSPKIEGVPDGLRIYESKNNVTDDVQHGYLKKRFEYVVQAVQAGDFEIPAQHFRYFDTKERRYKTLTTGPLVITVLPVPHKQAELPTHSMDEYTKEEEIVDDIKPLILNGPWQSSAQEPYYIPFLFFLLLFCVPCVWWLISFVLWPVIMYGCRRWYWPHKSVAYIQAVKKLKAAQQDNNYAALYPMFLSFFAQRWAVQAEKINQNYIEQQLKSLLSADELHGWNIFFNHVMQAAFFKNQSTSKDGFSLFDQASSWLALFKERL